MNKRKSILFYLALTTLLSVLIYWIITKGGKLESLIQKNDLHVTPQLHLTSNSGFSLLIIQIIIILLFSKTIGWIFKMIGQPAVVGEIAAGILLGPTIAGYFFPEYQMKLFPNDSLVILNHISQFGLILFMFIIGLELDLKLIKNKVHQAVVISHSSIIIPYSLGVCLSYFLFQKYAPPGISFLSFSLFFGIAMSITAFPILARILKENNLTKTTFGSLALTCAAADDVTAWWLLAIVVSISKNDSIFSAIKTMMIGFIFVITMFKVIRPYFRVWMTKFSVNNIASKSTVTFIIILLLCSSWITDAIGLHSLFGAFIAGVIMPNDYDFRNQIKEKFEDITTIIFLPIFFVVTGLNTKFCFFNSSYYWPVFFMILLVAIVGKFWGSALAAKVVGLNWNESLSIGALMNTRGLMQLIVLKIGYELNILTGELYSMFVLMALITTLMTVPLLTLFNRFKMENKDDLKN